MKRTVALLWNALVLAWHDRQLAELDERMLRDMGFEMEANLRRHARLSPRVQIY